MLIISDLYGQNTPVSKKFKVYGAAADIVRGALVEPGAATASLGSVVLASTTAPTMVVGLIQQLHDYSVVGDFTITAITTNKSAVGDVDVRPFAIYRAELAVCATQAITIAASSGAAGSAVGLGTTAGSADELGASWLYNAATDELRFVEDHDAAATMTLSNNIGTTAWAAVNPYFVPPIFFGGTTNTGLTLNATCDKIICEGNETGAWCRVLSTRIESANKQSDILDPAIHDNKSYADAKFYVEFVVLGSKRAF
jgi:hypothetical protein